MIQKTLSKAFLLASNRNMKRGAAKRGSKGPASTPARGKKPAKTDSASAKSADPTPNLMDEFFNSYASKVELAPGTTNITMEGLQRFCTDLQIDPGSDVRSPQVAILVIIWRCETQQYGTITKDEFKRGMTRMNVDTLVKLRNAIPNLRTSVSNPTDPEFRAFYKFVFEISREGGSKVLDTEICIALLDLLLANKFQLVPLFQQFLQQKAVRALNTDQWTSFLEFAKLYDRDLSRYDDDGACKT